MKKILLVEDDIKIQRYLQLELMHEGYDTSIASTGVEGLNNFKSNSFDVILLDLMLPELSGEEVCKEIRKTSSVPIIILTAKDQISNKIELLDMGADDYLTKPFDIGELFARIRVVLRNKPQFSHDDVLVYDDLSLDLSSNILTKDDQKITMTRTEYDLLYYLMINKEMILSREKILNDVWGYDFDGEDKIVDVYINALRKKLDNKNKKYINTIRGFGYVLKTEKTV